MAEQISRRSNTVTSATFEAPFETQIVRYGIRGLNLKDSLDVMEGWSRLTNLWHQHEGEATVRPGETPTAAFPAGTHVHSIRKLRDPQSGGSTRFWGANTSLYLGPSGTVSQIDSGYSGDPLALLPHRPTLSGDPWMWVGDRNKMRKVRSDGLVLPIGLPAPGAPSVALGPHQKTNLAGCDDADGSQAEGWVGNPGTDDLGQASGIPFTTDNPSVPPIIGPGSCVIFHTAVAEVEGEEGPEEATYNGGYDSFWAIARDVNLSTVGGVPASDDDLLHFWLTLSHPYLLKELRLYVIVSDGFDPTVLPGTMPPPDPEDPEAPVVPVNEDAYVLTLAAEDIAAALGIGSTTLVGRSTGIYQWMEFGALGTPVRRSSFTRIGSTPGRDWATVTGLMLYVRTAIDDLNHIVALGLDDLYLHGGSDPDTSEPGAQPYDYRITNYDPRTGAESNGSPEMTVTIDSARRAILVDPPAYGDSAVRQRIYRRGGSLIDDWYFVGENGGDGALFTDTFSDAAIAAAGTLPINHYQPVPTVGDTGATILAQPLPALWGPIEGMLFGCGDPHRPGYVYFSIPGEPDHWPSDGNTEVCAPSEELMNGGVIAHQGFVFSRAKLYFLYPNLSGQFGVTATPTRCTRGLLGRWSFCTGPGGVIYFVAEDGVFATSGGPESWISEEINPLFYGSSVNGYAPIDKTKVVAIRLTVWENDLYVGYEDTAGVRQVLVYSILQKFWRHYHFHKPAACLQGEDEDVLLIGGAGTARAYLHAGTSDDDEPIACVVRTGSASGGRREEKLFGDLFLDINTASEAVTLQVFLNEESHSNVAEAIGPTSVRERFLVHAFGASPQKAHSIACELRWSSTVGAPTLYQLGYAVTLQPDLTNTRVTNWDDLNSPDEVWLTGLTLDVDTGNQPKTFHVERDFNGERTTVATFTVTSNNRHKFKFSWPAASAHMVRIRPEPEDCAPWLLYRADWIYVQEPPRIARWDIHFENNWDQYYTGLDLYCDTLGQEKRIEVWVDEVRLTNTLAGNLPYWPVVANGRRVVHLTLPWGRGHVFRFVAIDDNPGLLYTHRWHLEPEPSEQANWNQNFSILGTHADKWLKAIIFECDTYGVNKSVNVEVDGVVVETLTVTATGRKVVQLALSQQRLGRVWRMFPIDANPGRLYTAEPIFDEEPFALTRWETQETNHGLPGWFYPLHAHITLKSITDVILTTVVQHNQVGGQTLHTYTIPATGGVKQRRFLHGFHAGKGVLIKYVLTSPEPFWLYRDETSVVIQPWGAFESIMVKPFGNDDQDPSRPMTHAILAAQSTGGTLTPGAQP